jgi:hypothetical protein
MFNKSELGLLIFCLTINLVSSYYNPNILSSLTTLIMGLVIGIDLGMKMPENKGR